MSKQKFDSPDLIRILIVDDHAVVRQGLRALIATEPAMMLVGEAANGVEAVQQALVLQPDVILMDLVMPRKDGIEAILEIKQHNAAARILVLTSFADFSRFFSNNEIFSVPLGIVEMDGLMALYKSQSL